MNSCRCWSENRHESSWNWLYLIFIDWITRFVDTGEDYIYMIPFESHLIQIDFKYNWKRNLFWIHIHLIFPLNWENALLTKRPSEPIKKSVFFERFRKYNQNQKSHLNLNFSDGFRKCIPYQKAIWIWIFQMDSELVFLTKRPSESEFFRWIQKLYSWPKGHLNPSESEFSRWIEKMYILVKRSLESIWHWNSFMDTGKRFCLLKPREKMLEGSTDHVFYWMITWIPNSFKCPDWFREKTWQIRSICNIFFRIPQSDCQRPIPESMST